MNTAATREYVPGHGRRMTAPRFFNRFVARVLRSRIHPLLSGKLILLTLRGAKTGRQHTIPVGNVQDGNELWVLVGDYETKKWWRNFINGGPLRVTLRGSVLDGYAKVVWFASDPDLLVTALTRHVRDFPGVRRPLSIEGERRPPGSGWRPRRS